MGDDVPPHPGVNEPGAGGQGASRPATQPATRPSGPTKSYALPRRYEVPERFRPPQRRAGDHPAGAPAAPAGSEPDARTPAQAARPSLAAPPPPPAAWPTRPGSAGGGGPVGPAAGQPGPLGLPGPRHRGPRGTLIAIAAVVVVVAVALGVYVATSRGSSTPARVARPSAAATPSPTVTSTAAASAGSGAGAAPQSPTAVDPAVCRSLTGVPPLTTTVGIPEAAGSMPDSFVVPTAGTNIAVCVARFTGNAGIDSGHVARIAVYTGIAATRYYAQLRQLQWTLVSASATAPVFVNGTRTTRVMLVQAGAELVLVLDDGV